MDYDTFYTVPWKDAIFDSNGIVVTPTDTPMLADVATHWDEAHQAAADAINALSASLPEVVRDALGAALIQGSNITITPNDAGDTITISAAPGYTDEQAQDAIAALFAAGSHSGITFAYNDAGNAISATVTGGSGGGATTFNGLTYRPFTVVDSAAIDAVQATDATSALQSVINAAGTYSDLYWPAGTYRAAGLVPLNGQRWIGPGVIQRVANSTASIVTGTDLTDFTLDGLTLDGSKGASTATNNSGLFITRALRVRVQNCTFRNMPTNNPACEFRGSTDGYIASCAFTTVGYGVVIGLAAGSTDPCKGNTITGNRFNGVDLNAVFLTENVGSSSTTVTGRVFDTVITNNTVQNWHDAGLETGSGCVRSVISGNVLDGGGNSGVLVRDNTDTVVANNIISNLTDGDHAGIACIGLNGTTNGLTLIGNQVRGANTGIRLGQLVGLEIIGGAIRNCVVDGIDLNQVDHFTISGARVRQSGQHGISVGVYNGSSSTYGAITGCTILDNATDPNAVNARDGITILGPASTDITITGNRIGDTRAAGSKTQRYGITVQASTNNRYVITGNNLIGNATGGLNDNGGTSKVVANNLTA